MQHSHNHKVGDVSIPPDNQTSQHNKINPGITALGGSLLASGLGFGVPGAIIGGILGFLAGTAAKKDDK